MKTVKTLFNILILIFCLGYVAYQAIQCLNLYLAAPEGVNLKMSDGVDEIIPAFTFCPETPYNETVLNKCNLTV